MSGGLLEVRVKGKKIPFDLVIKSVRELVSLWVHAFNAGTSGGCMKGCLRMLSKLLTMQ